MKSLEDFSRDHLSGQQPQMSYAEMMQKVRRALRDCTEVEMGAVEMGYGHTERLFPYEGDIIEERPRGRHVKRLPGLDEEDQHNPLCD